MIVNKELDGQGFVKQKKPYPDHRYIDDTTSWIYIVKTCVMYHGCLDHGYMYYR